MKISLKQLMLIMIGIALLLAILSLAIRGETFALGISISIAMLLWLFAIYQLAYFTLYVLAGFRKINRTMPNRAKDEEME